jgi:hypothetical protein
VSEHAIDALGLRHGSEVERQRRQHVVDPERGDVGVERAHVEPRYLQHGGENVLHRRERGIDIADEEAGVLADAVALHQAGQVEPRGTERLEDVVARGGEKPRLGEVGRLGGGVRIGQFRIAALELAQPVAIARDGSDGKQQPDTDERDCDDEPTLQHGALRLRLGRP